MNQMDAHGNEELVLSSVDLLSTAYKLPKVKGMWILCADYNME
jgi:hypothetical protein